ncbi:MarR family transcriptional regulator [Sporolactobacillus shoreicorticis]|uniref:MarR family winged helix-turn-helix transcriptional regulator n=1 Tax=Sporolactobacillus shoreicorticis TaxID=1923877 RepID=A0ABW5S7D1_9BACL|nr:helix-turn-helix domain-containing protein [Sporolactobacillus shoreicorticis]MCO7126910.1 MarR family transcriptional regulator [Sporolactobacillus shoreicorticis]
MKHDTIQTLIDVYEDISIYKSNKVHEAVDEIIKTHGITFEQLCLMRMLKKKPGMSPSQIAALLDINKSGVSIRVHRLIDKHFVEKRMIDNRSFGLYNTDLGQSLLNKTEQKVRNLVGNWINEIGEEDCKEFIRICTKINETIVKQKEKK